MKSEYHICCTALKKYIFIYLGINVRKILFCIGCYVYWLVIIQDWGPERKNRIFLLFLYIYGRFSFFSSGGIGCVGTVAFRDTYTKIVAFRGTCTKTQKS